MSPRSDPASTRRRFVQFLAKETSVMSREYMFEPKYPCFSFHTYNFSYAAAMSYNVPELCHLVKFTYERFFVYKITLKLQPK